jgi:hypothetical protein
VIHVSDRVPGEQTRIVVTGKNTEDQSQCTVIVIHEERGTWAIHGLGNRGIRLTSADMAALAEVVVGRTQ